MFPLLEQVPAATFSKREPTTPKHPRPRARCTVVAQRSQEDGHTGRCERTGAGKPQSDGGAARGRGGGQKRNVGEEVTDVNGSPDMRPECDLKRVCSVGDNRGQMVLEEKRFFHCPCCAELPTVVERARVKLPKARWVRAEIISQSLPVGVSHPTPANTSRLSTTPRRCRSFLITGKQSAQLAQFAAWAVRRALRRPPETSPRTEGGCRLPNGTVRELSKKGTEALPDAGVMPGEKLGSRGMDNAKEVVRAR